LTAVPIVNATGIPAIPNEGASADATTIVTGLSSCDPVRRTPWGTIIVNVLDRNGNPLRDLTKDSFQVKINKQPVTVLSASYEIAPRRIVVLLDMSGSMGGNADSKKWKIAREVVEDLLTQTPPEVQIAFLTFTEQVHDVFDFRESRSAISKWLNEGPTQRNNLKGRTAFRDAIIAGQRVLQPFRTGDAIYAITDGGDNSSHISMDRTQAALRESGVRLFAFLFAEYISTVEEVDSLDSLIEMASDSGGFVFGVPGRRAMDGVFVSPFSLDAVSSMPFWRESWPPLLSHERIARSTTGWRNSSIRSSTSDGLPLRSTCRNPAKGSSPAFITAPHTCAVRIP
jgi:hypothetical protein